VQGTPRFCTSVPSRAVWLYFCSSNVQVLGSNLLRLRLRLLRVRVGLLLRRFSLAIDVRRKAVQIGGLLRFTDADTPWRAGLHAWPLCGRRWVHVGIGRG